MENSNNNKPKVEPKPEQFNKPGFNHVKTTNVFKIVNFELFAKPNLRVMGAGSIAFIVAAGYLLYMRVTDEYKDVPTYNSLNEDGSFSRRIKKSKWD